jgi:NADP-dependent 3-hydroxy acid dehydrogenase YdfG
MKILPIGTGLIGGAVAEALAPRHEIVRASRRGEVKVDIEDKRSIEALFATVRGVDAVVVAPGGAGWGKLEALSDDDFAFSLRGKLMGQVNVVRVGMRHLQDGGSITVTSGILSRDPMPESAAVSLVNAGLEGFVGAAALNLPRGLRVSVALGQGDPRPARHAQHRREDRARDRRRLRRRRRGEQERHGHRALSRSRASAT